MVLGDLMRALRNEIVSKLSVTMHKLEFNETKWLDFLGTSTDKIHGDVTLPCHSFSKVLRKSPNDIATVSYTHLTLPTILLV